MWPASLASLDLPTFLSEIPITAGQVEALIYVIGAAVLVGGIGSINGVLNIIRFFRGDPPASQRYASKEDLAAALARSKPSKSAPPNPSPSYATWPCASAKNRARR